MPSPNKESSKKASKKAVAKKKAASKKAVSKKTSQRKAAKKSTNKKSAGKKAAKKKSAGKKSVSKKPTGKKAVAKKAATKKTSRKKASKKKSVKQAASKQESTQKKSNGKKSTRKKAAQTRARQPGARKPWLLRLLPAALFLLSCALVLFALYSAYLDHRIRQQFEGKRWALPARVYAQALELYAGKTLSLAALDTELTVANYRRAVQTTQPGTYHISHQPGSAATYTVRIHSRDFQHWDRFIPGGIYEIQLQAERITAIHNRGGPVPLLRLDPAQVAAIYPSQREDRDLLPYADMPETLVQALLLIEDRRFYSHHGVRPTAIARALLANLQAGRTVQGGSTLTQQLVKNYFLSRERSLKRKLLEAWMSVLLELHYSKQEILEAYMNEIFLGQDGERAIHGFGLAARYYFDKPLSETSLAQQALLVALAKGATYYNPRRHPQRAKQRRDWVLKQLAEFQLIDHTTALQAQAQPLGVVLKPRSYRNRYLSFTQLVKRQLQRDYAEADLRTEGLRIFTSLSPSAQQQLEQAISRQLAQLERRADVPPHSLQAAAVLSDSRSGEILALAGGRNAGESGFNRALDSQRQIGSLVKPAVFLTALQDSRHYNAASLLDDSRFDYVDAQKNIWSPHNYNQKQHGEVLLYQALSHSYNLATARLGLELGVPKVSHTLRRLGLQGQWPNYPSLLLGALESSPYQVAQMYQSFANQGFYTPLRAVREVVTASGERLQRYPLELEQRFPANVMYIIGSLLQKTASEGTARRLAQSLPQLRAAGKTGTTNAGRDSWFAGFTGEHSAVIWVGQDNHQPTALTGSSGALPIWQDLFQHLPSRPYQPTQPQDIVWKWVNEKGQLTAPGCENGVKLPFIKGAEPAKFDPCRTQAENRGLLQKLFSW